ncbi:uncharacterized protein B0H18DRAFT_411374 [Fomitopsis serialis]|uniref:uncharacterized protein n=1 Tax=Fomitopsis serialis TaxID=139415 RepID=UPI00200864FA|nr:uncharacterized protein B0H18DRAFT_411374 [Neoantrodia serialis]KAH9935355.1 hypothetical protein B0H18DRAFT_411374 [Neoantrodia serialis]
MSFQPTKFPSPIGGVPNPHDLAPSVVFAVLYALTIPLAVYRLASKNSRNLFIIASVIFAAERVVDFSFRAAEAETPSMRTTKFWVGWLQSAYAMGFIGLAGDVGNIARAFLLKSTRAAEPPLNLLVSSDEERAAFPKPDDRAATFAQYDGAGVREVFMDEPERRAWIERYGVVSLVMRLTALTLGGVYSGLYFDGITDHAKAVTAQRMRYASDIIVVVYLQLVKAVLIWALFTRPKRVARWPALFLMALCLLLSIPALYRLAAMANYTDSLLSMAPGSLNSPAAKTVFYTLHVAPEFVVGTLLLSVNVKKMFGFATWRGRASGREGRWPPRGFLTY